MCFEGKIKFFQSLQTKFLLWKALGDLVESCVGAILLDTGFDLNRVWKIMLSFMDPVMSFSKLQLNPIRELQELCQFQNWDLEFPTLKKDGLFLVEVKVEGKKVCAAACATNLNRKAARRMAAQQVCEKLKLHEAGAGAGKRGHVKES
ncbi:hypothetical protein CsSME_00023261 [Camellia sinensis var. sinensis]